MALPKNPKAVYEVLKNGRVGYDEDKHCVMILEVMMDRDRGTVAHFCTEAMITEGTFWHWNKIHRLFQDCYAFGKMCARRAWEEQGLEIRDFSAPLGTINYSFEYWKLIGWSRFGISKNSRIKLNLDPTDNPHQHYSQLLKQASEGDFTAAEIKQLMEAINVGLGAYQVFELQKEIDQLKSDLATMAENTNGNNSGAVKGTP